MLSLLCAGGTIATLVALGARVVQRAKLPHARTALLALILIGTLTNRTFLAWTSSGLETALYGLATILWVWFGLEYADDRRARRALAWGASAALACLTRPDALPAAGMTGLVLLGWMLLRRDRAAARSSLLGIAALIIPLGAFSLWKYLRYGSPLPNTYYAKVAAAWPEAGLRYVAAFALEYALWAWLIVVGIGVLRAVMAGWRPSGPVVAIVVTFAYQFGYYALVAGGDHFEFKAFAHTVPLLYVSFAWALTYLTRSPGLEVIAFASFLGAGWLIPWTHYAHTRNLETREQTFMLRRAVTPYLPGPLAFYGQWFDGLEHWLIGHFIGMRHQEHKVFFLWKKAHWPSRAEGSKITRDGFPVDVEGEAGYAGWSLQHVAILDAFALNDYYGARSPYMQGGPRRLAHSRTLPPGYVEAFRPNVRYDNGHWRFEARAVPLTAEEIVAIQRRYDAWLLHPTKTPPPLDEELQHER